HIGIAGAGTSAGHLHHVLQSTEWTNFLALLGSGVLTFLAGAEIDPISLKANWRTSVLIGVLSFAIPFVVVWLFAQFVFGWPLHQAYIARAGLFPASAICTCCGGQPQTSGEERDGESTRLNSIHEDNSYGLFCLSYKDA